MSAFNVTRIKLNSRRIWVEITVGFDTEVFQEPLFTVPDESQLREIHVWCTENQCGRRMSYDQFVFNNEKELSMFMLRWS